MSGYFVISWESSTTNVAPVVPWGASAVTPPVGTAVLLKLEVYVQALLQICPF